MEVQDLLKRAQDMLVTPASPPKVVANQAKQAADVDDWVDLHEDADGGSDSGWTTPSCSSSQPGSPRGGAPPAAPASAKPTSAAIAAPLGKTNPGAKTPGDAAQVKNAAAAAAVAPESPPQLSECPSPALAEKEKIAAAAGLTEADLQDLKAMMTTMKGDIGRCTQVAEQALATHSRPGPGGRGQFAWRVTAHAPPSAAAPALAPPAVVPEPVHRGPPMDLTDCVEVEVDLAQDQCSKDGFVINLKPKAGGRGVRLFVGDFEGSSLVRAMNKKVKTQHGRPMTYDFVKSSFEELGFKVAAVQVTSFVNNTYHALVHYEGRPAGGLVSAAVDSRPSDAINLALRFGAPVYVAKKVLAR